MKSLYQEMFAEIHASDSLREEVMNMTKREQRSPKRRKFSATLVAAVIVAAVLMGTAVAALVVPGTIQEWFAQQWAAPMEEGQTALIDSLTQKVGVSDTCGGVTVTVDSVTVGDSVLWLLLRAEGKDFQPFQQEPAGPGYRLRDLTFQLTPGTGDGDRVEQYGYDLSFAGADENGLTALVRFLPIMPGEQSLAESGGQLELHIGGLNHEGDGGVRHVLEGAWDFSFALEPVEEQQVLSVGTITVPGERLEPRETVEVELHNVEISATGLRYTMAEEEDPAFEDMIHILSGNWKLEMKDGTQLSHSGGTGHWSPENGGQRICNYYWITPIDLTQVKALWFGSDCYPLQ